MNIKKKRYWIDDALTATGSNCSRQSYKLLKIVGVMGDFVAKATAKTGKMEIALSEAARWYIYWRQHVSKSILMTWLFGTCC